MLWANKLLSKIENSLVVLKQSDFRILAFAILVSGAGSALVPIAFAIETTRVEERGWGLVCVMIGLWIGRFLGMIIYKSVGFNFHPLQIMIISSLGMGLAQICLLFWIWLFSNGILAMSISSLFYGFAAAFFKPSTFVSIPIMMSENLHQQANSILSIIGDTYAIMGPLLGAALTIGLGFEFVLMFDGITFFITIILLKILYLRRNSENNNLEKDKLKVENKFALNDFNYFPVWTYLGLLSWLFCSLAIGIIGVAGPTLIMANFSETAWAFVATFMAAGSLLGSTTSLLGLTQKIQWSILHLLCGLGLGIQLVVLNFSNTIWVVCFVVFLGAMSVTISGIRWDTVNQSAFTGRKLHVFASLDQFANNIGIPTGIILFGIAGILDFKEPMITVVGVLAFIFTIPVFLCSIFKVRFHAKKSS